MQPFLLVGVGGSGGKTLRAVKQNLQAHLRQIGWHEGIPAAWQFLHIDSVSTQDGSEFPAPFLEQTEYLSLVPGGVAYSGVYNTLIGKVPTEFRPDLERPLPDPNDVTVSIATGAGAYRAIGRTIAAAAMNQIHVAARSAFTQMGSAKAKSDLAAIARLIGANDTVEEPEILIISSVAGGSGAGMFIDVTEAVKSAAAGAPFADHTTAVLFAPDVFHQIGNMRNMAPNALGAISETMSGLWNATPTNSTQAMYKSQGVIRSADEQYRIGPKYVYLVGRKNSSNIDFNTQSGVYKAVGASVAAWLTSDLIQQNFRSYFKANYASRATAVPDMSRLMRFTKDETPFSALGFSRLSLGMERFSSYSAERLAKQALVTMLDRHLEQDPLTKDKTNEQWITHFADLNEGRFLGDSGLNEVTEANNQVIDALRPKIDEVTANFKASLQAFAESGAPAAGQSFNEWVSKITNAFETNVRDSLNAASVERYKTIRLWVEQRPASLGALVLRTVSEQGLPVTLELVRRLNNQVKKAAAELLEEKARHLSDFSNVTLLVSNALGAVATMNSIPRSNPAVMSAYDSAGFAFGWRAEADLKGDASELLNDLSTNLITPLEKKLASAAASLAKATREPKLPDLRDNPFAQWPDFNKSEVDAKYAPAPNEALLIDTNDYPGIFFDLVDRTVMDKGLDAKREVVRELIEGRWGSDIVKSLGEKDSWSLLDITQMWIPTNSNFQVRSNGAGQPAVFDFVSDHMAFVEMARKWVAIPGRAFSGYVGQKIVEFLDQKIDPENAPKRLQDFQRAFSKFVSAADPLVEINPGLLSVVHNRSAVKKMVICSGIPVADQGPLFDACKAMLNSIGFWEEGVTNNWFIGSGQGASASSIDIFTSTSEPYHPMVMSSVIEPVATEWVASQALKDNREAFMKWRRGRTLAEAIPAHPEVWQRILRGWFVARLLNQVSQDKGQDLRQVGPRVSVWSGAAEGNADFPFPLQAVAVDSSDDLPGVILHSLQIALVNCYTTGSLTPLVPYHRLLDLGDSNSIDLKDWIVSGSLPVGAPAVKADRAGNSDMDAAGRKAKCIEFFEEELKFFDGMMAKCPPSERNPRVFPLTWEIRTEVRRALQSSIDMVKSVEADRDL